jgi:YggT family protein
MNLAGLLCDAVQLYYLILIVRIILSWVPQLPEPIQPIANGVRAVTDPVLRPFRNLLPPVRIGMAALDLSPIILFLLLSIVVRPIVCSLTGGGFFL